MEKLTATLSGMPGRIVFSLPLIMFGFSHFMKGADMAGMVPVPGGVFWVYFTGICLLAGAIGIITNLKNLGSTAALLTGTLLLVFAFTIHLPAMMRATDEMSRMMPMLSFLKDLGLAGGAFVIAGSYKN